MIRYYCDLCHDPLSEFNDTTMISNSLRLESRGIRVEIRWFNSRSDGFPHLCRDCLGDLVLKGEDRMEIDSRERHVINMTSEF